MAKVAEQSRSDVRRAERCVEFKMVAEEEAPADYYALLSLLTSLMAVAFKMQCYCWLTLLFALASLANTKHSTADVKAIVATGALVLLVFISANFESKDLALSMLSRYARSGANGVA